MRDRGPWTVEGPDGEPVTDGVWFTFESADEARQAFESQTGDSYGVVVDS